MVVKKGDKVKVDYEGKFENGEIFDSSKHGDHSHPLEFTVGSGEVIKGFDEALVGMKRGEGKEFTIASEDAYGERKQELEKDIPKSYLPKNQDPKVGMTLMIGAPDGRQFPVQITKVAKDSITVDLNHPLVGKKLVFKIKLLEIDAQ